MAASGSILGNAVRRKEDPGLLRGSNEYCDDLDVEGSTHVAFVRSDIAHGTIKSVDIGDASSMPGVVGIYTAENLELPSLQLFPMMPESLNRPVLAKDKVRFVGDIVAMVVAETRAQAVDAAEMVFADIDALPVVVDCEAALADGAPLLFEENGSNICFATSFPPPAEDGTPPEPVDALEGADVVAECRVVSQRLAGVPMEPNGVVVVPNDPEGGVTCYVSTQAAHALQPLFSGYSGLPDDKVRVVAPWVGGGFGPKAGAYPEYAAVTAAAMALGRPVRWAEERSENMVSLYHGRDMVMYVKLGISNDGKFTGLDANVVANGGAYPAIGAILPMLTQMMSQAVYDIPKITFQGTTLLTNTTSIAAYRGAGRPEATQMVERVIDVAAAKIGMDPAEVRRKNYIPANSFPMTTLTGANYDSGEYEKTLDAAIAAADYSGLRAEQASRRESGAVKQLGIGVASYVEVTAPVGLHIEYGAIEINTDGTVTAKVGTAAHGQGHDTAFSMIISELLGVPMDNVILVQSDTFEVPRGAGTMGSRSLQTAGSALHVASTTTLEKAKQLAAHLLEANAEDIVVGDNALHVAGVPANALSWSELAQAAADDTKRPAGMEAGLGHELDFDGSDSTYPFGTHIAVVEVDTETGEVTHLRHFAVDDCGRILNPMLVEGQQHGGIAQGVAQALYEEVMYSEDGAPITGNLMDYAMPSAAELPSFDASNTETDSPRNPLGAKGIGESGTIGSTPSVHNAVVDAVSHLGVVHIDMPCTSEKVWQAIQAAG